MSPEPTTPTREQLSERELRTLIKCCEDAVAGYRRHLPKTANPNLWSMINYADVLAYHLKQHLTSEPAAFTIDDLADAKVGAYYEDIESALRRVFKKYSYVDENQLSEVMAEIFGGQSAARAQHPTAPQETAP